MVFDWNGQFRPKSKYKISRNSKNNFIIILGGGYWMELNFESLYEPLTQLYSVTSTSQYDDEVEWGCVTVCCYNLIGPISWKETKQAWNQLTVHQLNLELIVMNDVLERKCDSTCLNRTFFITRKRLRIN